MLCRKSLGLFQNLSEKTEPTLTEQSVGFPSASITDLHSAADAGNQQEAQTAFKEVEAALDQLKAEDPEAAFKDMH